MRSRVWVGVLLLWVACAPSWGQTAPAPLTRHPVVLVHGAFGFDRIGPIDYFNSVADALRGMGTEVLVTQTSAIHRTAHRARELKEQIERAFPDPAVKLNLIAHSQGGLDARYMITHLGMRNRVASLTTLGTPHRGTIAADLLLLNSGGSSQQALQRVLRLFGWDAGLLEDVSVRHMALFNLLTPDDPRILYQSWGARRPSGAAGARGD